MTVPQETLWPIDEHTKVKHVLLSTYLKAWFPILAAFNERIIYLDGFCGPGRYSGGEPGSPILALLTANNHRAKLKKEIGFYFIDEDKDRVKNLADEIGKLQLPSNFKIATKCQEFHIELKTILDQLQSRGANLAPTFAFIDPFGFSGVPFELIRRLLGQSKCEVLINLNVNNMKRFLDGPNEKITAHIIETLGTEDASNLASMPGDREAGIRELYKTQLFKHAKFVRYFLMKNKLGHSVYYLFFASNHALGHLRFKEAMWGIDQSGDFVFSDVTAGQGTIFEGEPAVHNPAVIQLLVQKFKGRSSVDAQEIFTFIADQTQFVGKHMRSALTELERVERIAVAELKKDGKKRKKGGFAEGTLISFKEAQ